MVDPEIAKQKRLQRLKKTAGLIEAALSSFNGALEFPWYSVSDDHSRRIIGDINDLSSSPQYVVGKRMPLATQLTHRTRVPDEALLLTLGELVASMDDDLGGFDEEIPSYHEIVENVDQRLLLIREVKPFNAEYRGAIRRLENWLKLMNSRISNADLSSTEEDDVQYIMVNEQGNRPRILTPVGRGPTSLRRAKTPEPGEPVTPEGPWSRSRAYDWKTFKLDEKHVPRFFNVNGKRSGPLEDTGSDNFSEAQDLRASCDLFETFHDLDEDSEGYDGNDNYKQPTTPENTLTMPNFHGQLLEESATEERNLDHPTYDGFSAEEIKIKYLEPALSKALLQGTAQARRALTDDLRLKRLVLIVMVGTYWAWCICERDFSKEIVETDGLVEMKPLVLREAGHLLSKKSNDEEKEVHRVLRELADEVRVGRGL